MTGDLIIIKNTSLRDVFTKGPKYREPKSINWKYEILMDFVEDYARQWVKRGLVGGDNNIFVMEKRHVFSNIWVFKIDVFQVLIDPLSFLIPICIITETD
jgi:hypothetical protein